MSSSNCCFLTCIRVSQGAGQVVWYSHLFQNFPEFIVIHTVKGFGIVNKVELGAFLELSCFFDDPTDVGNLISDSSAFSKSSLNIWKFTVHVLLKPGLENFEHYFASVWDEWNCAVVWTFFDIILLWDQASLVSQLVKNPPAMQETWVQNLGWEDPLEKGKATHSSILAWRIHSMGCIVHGSQSQTWLSDFHFFGIGIKTDLFQFCGYCWVFQICWHVECSTLTASSFRIWNNSAVISSLSLALFVVMLPKAYLTSHSTRCLGSSVCWQLCQMSSTVWKGDWKAIWK